MIQQTSIESYHQTLQETKTQIHRDMIYQYILTHPCCTRNEIYNDLQIRINIITGRIAELIEQGYIQVTGKKKDQTTNRMVQTLQGM